MDITNSSKRFANKALTIVQWGEAVLAETDLQSWDATNFTLNWTTNDSNAYVIHFIAIGGAHVSAKVVGWTMPTAAGNKVITGVGFQPTALIHAWPQHLLVSAPPSNLAGSGFGLGAMDGNGGQWGVSQYALDGVDISDTQRAHHTSGSIINTNSSLGIVKDAYFVSMDLDGFTLGFGTADANATQMFSLAATVRCTSGAATARW